MRLFSEKVNPTFNSSGHNILTVKDYNEIFFGVYEFEINGSKFVAEKTGELDDAPIVSVPVDYNNIVEQYDFVLNKGEQSIYFDPSTQSIPSQIKSSNDVEPLLVESVEEETDEIFLEEKKSAILEEIEKAKIAAAKYIKSIEKQNKRELVSYQTAREIALKEDIEKQKKILLDEFYSFVGQLKDRIAEESSDTALELKDIISEQLTSVSKDIDTRLSSAEKAIDVKLEERANELLNDVLLSEVKRSGKEIADDLNSQVKTIAENISKSLTSTRKQIEVDINEKLQEISTELNAKDKAIVELNNTLTKQSNRALSRIGTVKTQLESTVQDVVQSLEARIETASDRLEKYYAEKLQLVESSMTDVSEETKNHIIGLIKESHQSLQADIANIKVTVPNIVIEKSNGNQEIDVTALRTELEKSVSNRFVNEISSLKRLIELSSGGGSVAMQFAAGGTMQGNLTVVGTISARQYLGIPGGSATGDYLPLSGGTVTGDVSVSGLLSANRIGFNTNAGLTAGTGQLTWNDVDGTLELGLKGGVVKTEIGQGLITRVVNKTTPSVDLLGANYQVVVVGGAQGQRLSVKLAQADNDANSAGTLGVVAEDIPKNQEGFIITVGLLKNRNTTGSLQGESWSDGDILYLSPTVAGGITNIKPQAPQHTVIVGYVEYAHQNNGKIYVKIDNGYELDELHNVRITSVSANDVLKYNGTAGVWENSNTLTLSALSADRIYTTQLDALSANITVIDIKQYELSGFNVTGDVTINGSVSSQNISATSISISGVQAATVNSNVASATVLQTSRLINGVSFDGSSDITITVPISSGVTGLGSGISAFLATPTADNLRNAITQETGTGSLVFADLPSLSGATIANGTYTYNDATAAAHRTSLSLDRYYIPYGLNQQCSTVVYDFDNAMPPFNVGVTSSTPAGGLGQVTNAGGTHWNSKVKGWYHIANGSTNNAISELSFAGPQAYQGGTGTPTAWNNYTLVYVFCCPVLTDVDIRFGLRLGNVARIIQIFQDNTVSPGSSPIFNVFTSNGTYTTTGLATGALSGAPTPQAGSYITGTGTRYAFVFDTSQRAGGTSTSVQLKTFSGSVSGDLTLSATYELTGWNPVSGGAGPYIAVRNLNSRAGQATSLHVDTVIWKTWNHKTDILPAEILNILLTT